MTEDELAAIIAGIAPIIREHVSEAVAGLRDRIVVVETKATIPPPQDPALITLREQTTALTKDIDALREKVGNVLRDQSLDSERIEAYKSALEKDAAALRERVAVVETRAPLPGPAGKDGAPGLNGKDGADGLGFDDMAVEFDGDRTVLFKFQRGAQMKTFPIALPFLRYQGVYSEGKQYTPGDVVTWAGSTWTAHEQTTTKPGDGSKAWTLIVKRGRDGRDGKDAPGALPIVKVGT